MIFLCSQITILIQKMHVSSSVYSRAALFMISIKTVEKKRFYTISSNCTDAGQLLN